MKTVVCVRILYKMYIIYIRTHTYNMCMYFCTYYVHGCLYVTCVHMYLCTCMSYFFSFPLKTTKITEIRLFINNSLDDIRVRSGRPIFQLLSNRNVLDNGKIGTVHLLKNNTFQNYPYRPADTDTDQPESTLSGPGRGVH